MGRTVLLLLGAVAAAVAPVGATETARTETARADSARTEAAGLRFRVANDWTRVPAPSDMRAAQFRVPRAGSDAEDGELVLFFFGTGQGGSAEQNVVRWTGQFIQPDGTPSKDAAVVTIRTVNGLKQTSVDVGGTYKPAPMGGAGGAEKSGWRLLGAVVEGQGGPWFWRLTGPNATVAAAKPQFEALLGSLEAHQ
jgi:hypothetical protein